jgi:hypothetical protein
MEIIKIKSFNGIGDLLFVTPTLRRIKEAYPQSEIVVNTNFPELLENNPYVDHVGIDRKEGVFLGYPDPIHCKWPTCHHIISDWKIVCDAYKLTTQKPVLKPEIYLPLPKKKPLVKGEPPVVGVQVLHKGHWHGKKVWPKFDQLVNLPNYVAIPRVQSIRDLVYFISYLDGVVCSEGGISHIAKALDIPSVVIYGGFADPRWNGYEDQVNMTNEKWCSYCYHPRPCENNIERICMKEIQVLDVNRMVQGFWKIKELEQHNQMQFVVDDATIWVNGMTRSNKILDIGAGSHPFPNARPIGEGETEHAYNILEHSETVDFIFSSHCVEHLQSPEIALKEWARVLDYGGLLYLYWPSPNYRPWRKESMPKWHKHNITMKMMIAMLPEELYPIEISELDWFFGQKIVARKRPVKKRK